MSQKKFSGAPFGVQTSRFDIAGIHPKSKTPGTVTQVAYDKKCMLEVNRRLGPGSYNIDVGGFNPKSVSERSSGPGWERAFETARLAKIPHLLYKEQWEKKQLQKQLLGPGTYNINDFIDQMAKKPGSTRGVCETREARFDTTKMVCSKVMLPSSTHGQLHVHVSSITFSIQDNLQRSALEKKNKNPTI